MTKSLGTFCAAALLSCLIWIYADQISTETIEEALEIRFSPASADLIILPDEPGRFQVTLSGSHAQLELFKRKLENENFQLTYKVNPEDPNAESLTVDARKVVEELLRPYTAVSVLDVSPDKIEIGIDRYIEKLLPVRIETGRIQTNEPKVSPPKVKVTVLRSVFSQLTDEQKSISLDLEEELSARPDKEQIDLMFSLPSVLASHSVKIEPKSVNVRLKIIRKYDTKSFKLRVWLIYPPDFPGNYHAEVDAEEIRVRLKGPADVIANLKTQGVPMAYIPILHDDISKQDKQGRDVDFYLPAEVTLAKEQEPPRVYFRIVQE